MFGKIAIVAAVAAFASVAVAQEAPECSGSEALKFFRIKNEQCTTESGFAAVPPSGEPDDAQLTKMCASAACQDFIKAIAAAGPANCKLTFGGPASINLNALVTNFTPNCERLSGPSPPAVTTPAPTTAAPTTPAPTTAAPVPTTTAPSTPAPTTTAPSTPAPITTAPSTPAPTATAPSTPEPTEPVSTTPTPTTSAPVAPHC